ncbi:MAG: methyltransferase domain-containing protein [Flavobacteriales bacterium]
MQALSADFWEERYHTNDIPWDAGSITTPLKEYVDNLPDKAMKILVPGCGNAYEAEYLLNQGFKNTYILDYAPATVSTFLQRTPEFLREQAICEDFFEHHDTYDLILEQTFFCALIPHQREEYVRKIYHLLKPGGKLVGVLFNAPLNTDKVPYGGFKEEYLPLFSKYFKTLKMELCHNSIKPRAGRELFIIAQK